jgi:DNA-directed RNA polymerase specialized sigma54-like protein
MKQSLQLKLGQQLTMTPQLQQAIRLLQLSSMELELEIQQVLDSNMMLEVDEEDADVPDFMGETASTVTVGGDEGGDGEVALTCANAPAGGATLRPEHVSAEVIRALLKAAEAYLGSAAGGGSNPPPSSRKWQPCGAWCTWLAPRAAASRAWALTLPAPATAR